MTKILNLVEILNPFEPRDRSIRQVEWGGSKSITDYFPMPAGSVEFVIALNGRVIPTEEASTTFPEENDFLVVCPVPRGGGNSSGKQALRIIALIAVMMVAPEIGALMGPGMFGAGVFGLSATAWTAIVMVGGTMIVNALLPPPKGPEADNSPQTYGIDGAKNTSAQGVCVPVLYGEMRYGGNIINNYVINEGDTQWLYMLINCGEGPIDNIDNILINDQPISSYQTGTVETAVRLGTSDQAIIPWFDDTIVPQSLNHQLTTSPFLYTTATEVDRLRLDFYCPAGLYDNGGKGEFYPVTVPINIEYRLNGTSDWLPFPSDSATYSYVESTVWDQILVYNEFGNSYYTQYVPNGTETRVGDAWFTTGEYGSLGQLVGRVIKTPTGQTKVFNLTGQSRNAVRRSITSRPLAEGIYDVRVSRVNAEITDPQQVAEGLGEIVFWSDCNEITTENINYANTALLALKIRLTDQLSSIPTVTHMNRGKLVRVWDFENQQWALKHSKNPAWVALDILTNKRYGGGCALSRIDLIRWREWARFCEASNIQFNGVFDASTNVWDALQTVLRVGRAQIIRFGTRYSLAIEKPESPSMMFTVGNMIEGTFKETWLPTNDRINEIEATFYAADDNYRQRTIRAYDRNSLAQGATQRVMQMDLKGITNAQQAWDHLWIMLNMNRYISRTVEFAAPLDAINCTIGDVVLVQHDMPQWGIGGRLAAGSTTTVIQLDREVTMEYGKSYKALVHQNSVLRYSSTVASVITVDDMTVVGLNGFDNVETVTRLKVGSTEYPVRSIYYNSTTSRYEVSIPATTAISAGNAYQLWQTDAVETKDVVNPATIGVPVTTTTLTLQTALTSAPIQFANFMFGEVGKVAKPFRIKSISGSHEYRRDITAIEYNASVYSSAGAVPTANFSAATSAVNQAVIQGTDESLVPISGGFKSQVTVHFNSTQQTYVKSKVYVSINSGAYQFVAEDANSVTIDAGDNDVVTFRVVAVDVFGKEAPVSAAPTITHTVVGKTAKPGNVVNFIANVESFGIRMKWDKVNDIDLDLYEIRYGGTSWADATPLVQLKTTDYFWKLQTVGTYTLRIKARDTSGNYSASETTTTAVISIPAAPTVTYQLVGADELLSWNVPASAAAIDGYEIRYGTSWAAGTFVATTKALSFRRKVQFVGPRTYWVAAIDAAGNTGTAGSTSVSITAPGAVTSPRTDVVDNNVLFYWNPPATGSLPIDYYEIRRGSTYAGSTLIGSNGNSTFGTVFEQQSGSYTYWINGFDTAGNSGTPASVTATVSQPPDYVLRTTINSVFGGTKTNVILDGTKLVGPVNTTETFAQHFTNNSWTTPAQQVSAGYPLYIQPSVSTGSYEEIYDYGSNLPPTTITVTPTFSGGGSLSCQIYYKLLSGDAWTAAAPGYSVLTGNFRYVRVVLTFSNGGVGTNLVEVTGLQIKLANKLKTDSGTFTITNANAGVVVPFNVAFVDADTPLVQPNGTTALVPIVDYSDVANPTGFTVYLHNPATGVKVTGSGSWTARGY